MFAGLMARQTKEYFEAELQERMRSEQQRQNEEARRSQLAVLRVKQLESQKHNQAAQ